MNNMSNKELKIGDTVYIDILDTNDYMCALLPNHECLKNKITNITDKYIQVGKKFYNVKTNEQILSEDDNYSPFVEKIYQSKEELFAERKRFKKYKIIYEAIKNETEYASFLSKLSDEVLDVIIQHIKSQS